MEESILLYEDTLEEYKVVVLFGIAEKARTGKYLLYNKITSL